MTFEEEMKELKAREAAAAAALEPIEAERAKREELAAYRREVERKERAVKEAPEIARLEAEHGPIGEKIAVVETDEGAIVLKRPAPVVFKRFQDAGDSKSKSDTFASLVKPCVIYPDMKRFNEILEALPATLSRCADEVVALAGFGQKEAAGK
jgi:hypothetical protein